MAKRHHYRKVPEHFLKKAQEITNSIIVACVLRIPAEEIQAGKFTHAGISITGGELSLDSEFTPLPERGRYSRWNLDGRTIIRRDLPKVIRRWDLPIFGDWSNGSFTREMYVYPREFLPPRELTIAVESLGIETTNGETAYSIKFSVNENLNKHDEQFQRKLLENLNLLLENTGNADVFSSTTSDAEFRSTLHVDWELLPVGDAPQVLSRLMMGVRRNRTEVAARIEARRRLLEKLGPAKWIVGMDGFRRYFGAQFKEDLVVFENVDYGNAIYVMFTDWRVVSRLSRLELLGSKQPFIRIVHRPNWEEKLERVIRDRLDPPSERRAA